jgi:hypothetical protein
MEQSRRDMERKIALKIAYTFLGTAGNILAREWPSHSEQISPEIYNQVIKEFEAHGNMTNNDKTVSERAIQAFEAIYGNRHRGPDVQPNVHEAPGYPNTNPYPGTHPRHGEAAESYHQTEASYDTSTRYEDLIRDSRGSTSGGYSLRVAHIT